MLRSFSIRTRIYTGFGLLILISIGLAAFSTIQLGAVGAQSSKVDALSGNVGRVLEAARTLEAARRAETRLRLDGDPAALSELRASINTTQDLMAASARATLSDTRRRLYNGVSTSLQQHSAVVDQFADLSAAQLSFRRKLFTGGDDLAAAANKLVASAAPDRTLQDAEAALSLYAAVLQVRIANWRFLATDDPKGIATFRTKFSAANLALAACQRDCSAANQGLTGAVRAALDAYSQEFDGFSSARSTGISLYEQTLQPQIVDMQNRLAAAKSSLIEAMTAAQDSSQRILAETAPLQEGLAAFGTVIGIFFAFIIGRGIVRPVTAMTGAMSQLAKGDTDIMVPARDRTDEIGQMARAVEVFRQQAIDNRQLSADAASAQVVKDRRQKAMDSHTQDFGKSIAGVMTSLSDAAAAMRKSASAVTDGAERTRSATSTGVDGAQASSRDLNAVAAAAEQLANSITEISQQVTHVTTSVRMAVTSATETSTRVAGLSEAADRIGDVVQLITSVASQTNLLALNATIEAARAGEAGKGFAVVASEVKALATQTAGATDQIKRQIIAIRDATSDAVNAVRGVTSAIGKVEMVATAIAAAVEQQAAATREITGSVQQVTQSTNTASIAMEEVLAIAEITNSSSLAALQVAEEVGRTADTLQKEVGDFLAAMSQGDEAERRRYERIPGGGASATLRANGETARQIPIVDISRGGIALGGMTRAAPGADAELDLPGGVLVKARIARAGNGSIALVFRQDGTSLEQIDRALRAVQGEKTTHAA